MCNLCTEHAVHKVLTHIIQHILYPTNAPRPIKAESQERTKKYKCPVRSCRGLELQSRSLSAHHITVYGRIHVPATLPNYVHMLFMNSSFQPPLNHRNLVSNLSISFYSKQQKYFIYFQRYVSQLVPKKFLREASFTVPSIAVNGSLFMTA